MGSSESIHNDTSIPVDAWFQLNEGDCPADGKSVCMETTLQPGWTTGKKEFSLRMENQVCVRYMEPDGLRMKTETVCKAVTSPQFAGQHVKYEVTEIIGSESPAGTQYWLPPASYLENHLESVLPAVLALAMLSLFILRKRGNLVLSQAASGNVQGSSNLPSDLKEKLLEEGSQESIRSQSQEHRSYSTWKKAKMRDIHQETQEFTPLEKDGMAKDKNISLKKPQSPRKDSSGRSPAEIPGPRKGFVDPAAQMSSKDSRGRSPAESPGARKGPQELPIHPRVKQALARSLREADEVAANSSRRVSRT
eukprot:gnl/MRDRNA2_/MRDRNA2_107734_c0_seq1.p1 gnl/MRDRNA2_/MRDRNA2_107734_c0~~gnl/MRDRNA2_/MRDRNA2_107734_c0_seq1.p1  ORF type:complete len:307 (+),score=52.99 gnl/MRDRNA2_/MRDRNA2_107734_c0_seq1:73-993(+)